MLGMRATIASAGVLLLLAGVPAGAADAVGVWLTEGGKARVRIGPCGDALCGVIVGLEDPNDPATGRPKTDKNNSDAGKRSRPIVGIQMLIGMKPAGTAGKWSGQVYNAEDGKTYAGSITLTGENALTLEGCALGGLICRSQTWARTK